jgi:hypothetical protein
MTDCGEPKQRCCSIEDVGQLAGTQQKLLSATKQVSSGGKPGVCKHPYNLLRSTLNLKATIKILRICFVNLISSLHSKVRPHFLPQLRYPTSEFIISQVTVCSRISKIYIRRIQTKLTVLADPGYCNFRATGQ